MDGHQAARIVLWLATAYVVVGGAFALGFVARGIGAIDPGARGAPLAFRILIVPGAAALWPALLIKWIRARGKGALR